MHTQIGDVLEKEYHAELKRRKQELMKEHNPDEIVIAFRKAIVQTNAEMRRRGIAF